MSETRSGIPMRFLDARAVRHCLQPAECIELMATAMRQVSLGQAELPLRHGMPLPGAGKALGMMPGYLDAADGRPSLFGIKLVSLFADNPSVGLPSHMGLYVLYEAENGQPLAVLDADAITSIRTAAATAMATRALARPGSNRLALLGTGEQAREHARALCAVYTMEHINIWGRNPEKAEALASELQRQLHVSCTATHSVNDAVSTSDIICTVTASREPILYGEQLPPGVHLNLVGASFPDAREVDTAAIMNSRYFVDYRVSALNQAGELIHAVSHHGLDENHIRGEIGELLLQRVKGRELNSDRTVYKSLGVAAQDIAAAWHVYQRAEREGLGQEVTL